MAHGVTEKMREFGRLLRWREKKPWEPVARDRSLNGKDRIRARKAANKESRKND